MDHPKEITVLSLCAGYGGLELGLACALANPLRVVAVEIEAYALANLEAKASEGRLAVEALWPDLRSFPAERFRGCFDFILAGYPCQPFSVAGKRKGADDPRHLWPHIARIVEAVEPFWCLFENVPGHLTIGFPAVYRSLRDMGYSVEAGLFTAAECSCPMRGKRLFVLGTSSCYDRGLLLQYRESQKTSSDSYRADETSWPPRPCEVNKIPRAVDGSVCRVDRLRLLGNGVVPAQAELAFRTLFSKFQMDSGKGRHG